MNIKEVSQTLNIPADTLRYWERVGVVPPVHRASSGYRDYTESDLDWCNFAHCMRDAGVSIEALIEYIDLYQQGPSTQETRKQLLTDQLDTIQQKLNAVQSTYDKLAQKIKYYDAHNGLNPFEHHK